MPCGPRSRTTVARSSLSVAPGPSRITWRHITVVLDASDEEAEARARRITRDALRLTSGADSARWTEAVQLDRDRERGRADPDQGRAQVAAYVRRSIAGAYVGSPETVAERIGLLRTAGVDTVQLDTAVETDQDRQLRRDLVTLLKRPELASRRGW
ncbi:LLM class flavin-dependent oxidoreductase [Streptomyces sp. ISL-1]|uniref:LLM class flavin-dependent oxidoreductase n=1 Tax=Streptomyces sp. ISL-1 TaxID=2817657 RepID=UPI001BE8618A|nr:LLM class flavin-dependent oxidoreductase [Streptomyces sp. ISL-1]MBT2388269.1 LLM class flavin-dependent oxidoreductase [Streptomyces sp. ISL-1]